MDPIEIRRQGVMDSFKEAPPMHFWLFKQRSNHISACNKKIIEITYLNYIDHNTLK